MKSGGLRLRKASFGGMALTGPLKRGEEYDLAVLNLETFECRCPAVEISFSSNLILTDAAVKLEFQLMKIWGSRTALVPVSSGVFFSRSKAVSEADSICFSVCDCDAVPCGTCSYIIKLRVLADMDGGGCVSLWNPSLTAVIKEF